MIPPESPNVVPFPMPPQRPLSLSTADQEIVRQEAAKLRGWQCAFWPDDDGDVAAVIEHRSGLAPTFVLARQRGTIHVSLDCEVVAKCRTVPAVFAVVRREIAALGLG